MVMNDDRKIEALRTTHDAHAQRQMGWQGRCVLDEEHVDAAVQDPLENSSRNAVGGAVEVTQKSFGIIRWKEEGPVLFPFALGGKERKKPKGLLVLWFNHILLEMAGENEYLVPHLLQDFYPLFGLQGDAVDVPDTTDDYSDSPVINLLNSS